MSQYQRQRKSEEEFQDEVNEYYEAKKPYDELIANMPVMPSDQGGDSEYRNLQSDLYLTLIGNTGDKVQKDLQSAAREAGKSSTKATAQDHQATPVRP